MKRTIVLAVGIAAVAVIALLLVRRDQPSRQPPEADPSQHPVYSSYDFERDQRVINIGTQPLFSPAGVITAAIARDGILREQLRARGMEIRYFPFLKGSDVNFFVGKGLLDAGISGDMPALVAAATLNVVITSLVQIGPTSIVADRNMLVSELRGKRIAYPTGSNAHFALLGVLASEEIPEEQVRMVPMDVDEMPGALLDGAIDAFSAWEPFVSVSLDDDPNHAAVQRTLSSGYLYFLQRFVDQHPEATSEILAAEFRAIAWITSSFENLLVASRWAIEDGLGLTAAASAVAPAALARAATLDMLSLGLDIRVPGSFLEEDGQLAVEFAFLQRHGEIIASASWALARESFDDSFAIEIAANPIQFRLWEFRYDVREGTPQ